MLRFSRWFLGFVLLLSMTGREARAQWGWGCGGWGWGGWGVGTVDSADLQGAASFAMGAGMYNLNTAQAISIDTDTAMRFNEYMAAVSDESARRVAARNNSKYAKNKAAYEERRQELRANPSQRDIESGDALNLAVEDLSDPRLGSATIRAAKAPISAELIGAIPFVYASERVTLMLDDIRESIKWPEVFEHPRFADDKQTFDELVTRIRAEADKGDISEKTLRDAKAFGQNLRAEVQANPLPDPVDQKEANRFLTASSSVMALLAKPNIRPALLELRKVKDTTIGNLLGFMHVYNLRFGPAKTTQEKNAYQQLFPILDSTRDQIQAEARLDQSKRASRNGGSTAASDFYHKLEQGRQAKPVPPPASNPQ